MRKKHAIRLEEAGAGRARQGERRVVTILICDIAGSTAMAEQIGDPGLRAPPGLLRHPLPPDHHDPVL